MILHRDDSGFVVDKPAGMADASGKPEAPGAVEWLALHHGLDGSPSLPLETGASGVLTCGSDAPDGRAVYDLVSHHDVASFQSGDIRVERVGGGDDIYFYRAEAPAGDSAEIRRLAATSGMPLLGDTDAGGRPWPRLGLHRAAVGEWKAATPPSFLALAEGRDPAVELCRDRRGGWLASVTDAFRAIHRDEVPGLPAAVDVYGEWFDGVWFDESVDLDQARATLQPILEGVAETYGCRGGTMRIHRRNPHKRTLVTDTTIVGDTPPERFTVSEHGLKYEISLTETQHTGLFLDQRDTRRRLFLAAEGTRLGNLFAYTCSFSVVAAAAGADVAFSVDVAKACLTTGKTNFELNGLTETGRGKFVQEDARKWLRRQRRRRVERPDEFEPFDLIVCDPPVFASSKDGGKFSVEKEWQTLAEMSADLLYVGGAAVFANNHRSGDHEAYRGMLEAAFDDVIELAPPLDFPVSPGAPHHVRTFLCRVM